MRSSSADRMYTSGRPDSTISRSVPSARLSVCSAIVSIEASTPVSVNREIHTASCPALRARFHRIEGLRPGAGGELYIGDVENHRVRMIDRHGSVITIAGTGVIGTDPDFAPASLHTIGFPAELAVHPDGRVFFSDTCANFVEYLRVLVPVPF